MQPLHPASEGSDAGVSVHSSGSGNTAGRDVNATGLTINNNVGRAGQDLSVHAEHYDRKVVEIEGLKRTIRGLTEQIATLRAAWTQDRESLVAGWHERDRAHAMAMGRLSERRAEEQAEYAQELHRLQETIRGLEKRPEPAKNAVIALARGMAAAGTHIGSAVTAVTGRALAISGLALGAGLLVGWVAAGLADPEPRTMKPLTEFALVDLPCQEATWGVRLGTIGPRTGEEVAKTPQEMVRARLDELTNRQARSSNPVELDVTGPGRMTCSGLVRDVDTPDEDYFVFSGPYPDKKSADSVCSRLGYVVESANGSKENLVRDCLVRELVAG